MVHWERRLTGQVIQIHEDPEQTAVLATNLLGFLGFAVPTTDVIDSDGSLWTLSTTFFWMQCFHFISRVHLVSSMDAGSWRHGPKKERFLRTSTLTSISSLLACVATKPRHQLAQDTNYNQSFISKFHTSHPWGFGEEATPKTKYIHIPGQGVAPALVFFKLSRWFCQKQAGLGVTMAQADINLQNFLVLL